MATVTVVVWDSKDNNRVSFSYPGPYFGIPVVVPCFVVAKFYDAVESTSTGIKKLANVEVEVTSGSRIESLQASGPLACRSKGLIKIKTQDERYKIVEMNINTEEGVKEIYLWRKNTYGR